MKISRSIRASLVGVMSIAMLLLCGVVFAADHVNGQVTVGGEPVAEATVTLWDASAGTPKKVSETKTNDDGKFDIRGSTDADSILYLVQQVAH